LAIPGGLVLERFKGLLSRKKSTICCLTSAALSGPSLEAKKIKKLRGDQHNPLFLLDK
jgi:hypothetical protein